MFDRVRAPSVAALELGPEAFNAAFDTLEAEQRDALVAAGNRVRAYHAHQRAESWSFTEADGTRLGQQVTPLERVGIYVPGGKAAYPSSVLMNALPAQVAGVREIVMVVPTPGGARNPLVLAAAHVAGVTRAFTIGGAQAIAALAYGTATIPAVDKIVGPGNAYGRGGQAQGVRRRRHRHDRRPVGDHRHRRRQREPRLDRDGPLFPRLSTTRSRERSCSRPTRR